MSKTNKTIIKEHSKWSSVDGKAFVVLHTVEAEDGHVWVHYRSDSGTLQEYSCYQESFLSRFTPLPE